MRSRKNIFNNLDWFIISIYLLLVVMGWLNIYSASYNEAHASIFDTSQEYGKQFIWMVTSILIGMAILLLDGDFIKRISPVFYAITCTLLVLVLIFGKEVNGAKAWFGFGSFGIQPSEFSKVGISLLLAHYLSSSESQFSTFRTKLIAVAIIAFPAMLIMLQPDTGTVLVFAAYILVLYREGLSGNILLLGLLAGILSVLSLILKATEVTLPLTEITVHGHYVLMFFIVLIGAFIFGAISKLVLPRHRKRNYALLIGTVIGSLLFIGSLDQVFEKVLEPHQKIRINILLGLEEDPLGAGYNVKQSQTAIGSGGFSGKGYLDGTLTKFKYVPMQSTDFIFCTIGEEWGFLGSTVIVLLFITLIYRLIALAERQKSAFSRIYGYSVAMILFFHFAINIGMTMGLVPIIGLPLPFFSYGGSSLWGFTILLFTFIKLDSKRLDLI